MKYFTIDELIKSQTANVYKINNTPNKAIEKNLVSLIEMLDKIREKWGSPLYVNSGYRCEELNRRIGGVANSDHLLGIAVDLDTRKGEEENKKLFSMIKSNFPYHQLIFEKGWVHYSYKSPNKKESLKMDVVNGKTTYSKM